MKKRRVRIHRQTLHLMNDPEYVYIWVNPEDKEIAICSCEERSKDALKVPNSKNCDLYSSDLFFTLKKTDLGLAEDKTYRFQGQISKGNKVARFNIKESVCSI